MRNSFTIWAIGIMLAALGAVGMQSCSKDTPEPPKQEDPTTPDNPDNPDEPDEPDTPKQPFDPNKPYRPVNKLSQVFKHGYLKTETSYWGIFTEKYNEREYIIDDNNNLVKIIENNRIIAEFEYGHFTDPMGDSYQVKYTTHLWTDELGDETTVYLCKLNEDEMVIDQYKRKDESGYFYEYEDNHLVKIYGYTVSGGRKIKRLFCSSYEWRDNNLIKYYDWWLGFVRPEVSKFNYPTKDFMIANRGGVLLFHNNISIEYNLFMAALMGQPSEYLPSSLTFSDGDETYINEITLTSDGLPEKIIRGISSTKYEWRHLN